MAWADVKKEMTEEKGLDGEVADRIGEYVKLKGESPFSALFLGDADVRSVSGGPELVDRLRQDEKLSGHKAAKEGIEDMALLFKYLDIFNVSHRVSLPYLLAAPFPRSSHHF